MAESLDSSGFLPPPTLPRPHISNWAAAVEQSLRALEGSVPFGSPPAPQPLLRGMASPGGSGRVEQPPGEEDELTAPGLTELLEAVTRGGSMRQSPGVPPSHAASHGHAGAVDAAGTPTQGARAMPSWTAPAAAAPADDAEELSIDSRAATPRVTDIDDPASGPTHRLPQHHRPYEVEPPQGRPNSGVGKQVRSRHNHNHQGLTLVVPSSHSGGPLSAVVGGTSASPPGRLFALACDAEGSRVVQRMLDSQVAVASACDELLPHLGELLCHPYGNYAVQRVLEHGDVPDRMRVAEAMRGRAVELALDVYGCRVLQRLIDTSVPAVPPGPSSPDAALVSLAVALLQELDGHLDRIICDQNGNHVAQKILDCAPPHVYPTAFLVRAFCDDMPSLGRHCYGCRVAQKVFEVCGDGSSMLIPESRHAMERLLQVVYDHLPILVTDQYGNYVVQHMIANATPVNRSYVIARLAPEIGVLACDKFGSNVAERILRCATDVERDGLVDILVTPAPIPVSQGRTGRLSPAASHAAAVGRFVAPIALLMHDQFANYVVQRIIELATRPQQQRLVEAICAEIDLVRSTTFGQHLLLRLERLAWVPLGVSGLSPTAGSGARGSNRGPHHHHGEADGSAVGAGSDQRSHHLQRDDRSARPNRHNRNRGAANGDASREHLQMHNQPPYGARYQQQQQPAVQHQQHRHPQHQHQQHQQQHQQQQEQYHVYQQHLHQMPPPQPQPQPQQQQQQYHPHMCPGGYHGVSFPATVHSQGAPFPPHQVAPQELHSGACRDDGGYGGGGVGATAGYVHPNGLGGNPGGDSTSPVPRGGFGSSGGGAGGDLDLARARAAEMLRQHNPDGDLNSEAVALVAAALMMTQQKPPTPTGGASSVPPGPPQRHHDPYAWRGRR